jgi:hypothetical protein
MKNEWRQYLDNLNISFEFLHADELKADYQVEDVQLPAVFKIINGQLELIVDANAINSCRTIDDLKQLINAEINS